MTMIPAPVIGSAEDPRGDLVWGTIPRLVEWAGENFGDSVAVIDGETRLSFVELASQVDDAARGFVSMGLEPGDRVALWAPNCVEWIIAALGALRAGGVVVTLNTRYKGSVAAYILQNSGAKVLFTVQGFLGLDFVSMLHGEDLGQLEHIVMLKGDVDAPPKGIALTSLGDVIAGGQDVPPERVAARVAAMASDDIADMFFTSGTTGFPKGVMTSHAQTLRVVGTWASIVGLRHDDQYLIVNPFFHTFGYKTGLMASLMAGATVIPEPVFDVDKVLHHIDHLKISMLPGPPALYQSILSHPDKANFDLSSLRLAVTGAAVVPVELVAAMREELKFETVVTAYGLTESVVVTMCRSSDSAEVIAHSSGRAIPDVEVRIVDAQGVELPRGDAGEIVVRGYPLMRGYFGDDQKTKETIDEEGWLHTGDVGTMDGHGNIAITDRIKDMFVMGGFNAYPAEIEAMLRPFPGIADIAVIGVPDERMGEVGCAVVVRNTEVASNDDVFAEAIKAFAKEKMANFKVPRYVEFIGELPRNAGGKVLKRELRDTFGSPV